MINDEKLLTPAEVATLLQVAPVTVRSWVSKGWLEASITPGGHRRFNLSAVERFCRERGVPLGGNTGRSEHMRILIVDDDVFFRECLKEALRSFSGCLEIKEAADGFSTGVVLERFQPDVVLLDFSMPGLSGAAVCREIRSNPSFSKTHVIGVTGLQIPQVEDVMLKAGADHVLFKPIDFDVLDEILHDVFLTLGKH